MKITELFEIKYPIIQGGMIWCSGHKLASAVSNAGGLGLIGAGSMHPEVFEKHIIECKKETSKPFGVNIPLLYPEPEKLFEIVFKHNIKIVFTSAGSPAKYTNFLQKKGIKVAHVVANVKFAKKCEEVGVDAIVAEGFEAGGHNGREESTTMTLIPIIKKQITKPLIAAGGIATGRGMLAALALGADGVQIGSRFVASKESSAHENFKNQIIKTKDGDTQLCMKKYVPVRLIKNKFFEKINELEAQGASQQEILDLLGKGRAKRGMFEGDLDEGELEIGQISGLISEIKPVNQIINDIINEFYFAKKQLSQIEF